VATWDTLEAFAFGQIGLMPDQFYDLLPREWENMVSGWNEKQNRKEQTQWERTRWIATILLNPHTKKRISQRDLIVFPWEKEPKKGKKVWTRGEILDVINKRKERAKHGKSIES
jgi:hypothetical protein